MSKTRRTPRKYRDGFTDFDWEHKDVREFFYRGPSSFKRERVTVKERTAVRAALRPAALDDDDAVMPIYRVPYWT